MSTRRGSGRLWGYLCLVAAVSLLTACVTGPIQLDMRYPEGAVNNAAAPAPASRACGVTIAGITDERGNKQSLGNIGASQVYGENIEAWVRRALTDLDVIGYRVVEGGTMPQPLVRMDIRLKQSYVRSVLTSIESAVRLTVRYTRAGGATVERSYRGGYTRLNWVAASDEIMGTLNHAMVKVVQDIAKDLPELCGT